MTLPLAKDFANKVRGPVVPILTMFNASGEIDERAIGDYVEFLIEAGVGTLMCTVGTSRYDVLTTAEMLRVNAIAASAARRRAVVIATTPSTGPTVQAVEFAREAARAGADAVIAVYPDRYYGEEPVIRFFADVCAASDIGVMIHEMPIRAGRAFEAPSVHYSLQLVGRILKHPLAVGLKEESANPDLIRELNGEFSGKAAVIGGRGGMAAHLGARPHGQVSYLASIGNFAPAVELAFFQALESGNDAYAQRIVSEYEKPFFDAAVNLGWHLALREAMASADLCPPFERRPMMRLPAEERRKLDAVTARILDFSRECAPAARRVAR